jgi:hypothetical protein
MNNVGTPQSEFRLSGALDVTVAEEILVPRSQWLPRVMRKHPEVLEFRERFRPLGKISSFGRSLNCGKTEVKETLSHQTILQLIMQFLEEEGMEETKQILQVEAKLAYTNSDLFPQNTLLSLLRLGVKDPKHLFENVENEAEEEDSEVQVYDYVPKTSFEAEVEEEDKMVDDDSSNLVFDPETKEVMFATLNNLVSWLTSASNPDLATFRKIFLMTYQSFTTSDILLHKLIQRYHLAELKGGEAKKQIHQRIFTVTKYWIQHHATDWNEKLIATLNNFIDNTLIGDGYLNMAKQLRNAIAKMESGGEKAPEPSNAFGVPPEPKVPKNIFSPTLTLDDVDEEEIARQLTLLEYEIYSVINASELLSKAWCDGDGGRKQRAPHVTAALKRFNDISRWVTISILDAQKVKLCARVMARFIKIAEHLRKLNNYNTLMAVFTGLNNSSVHRLRYTRRELPREQQKTLEELEKLLSCENSYANYRAVYKKGRPPTMPFIGLHLRDLEFVEESNPDFEVVEDTKEKKINFHKRRCAWQIIVDLLRFQPVPFNFHYVHQISTFLRNFDLKDYSEEEMFLKSLTIEGGK